MSTPITAGMPLSVQNPTVKEVFEPTVMFRSGIVHRGQDRRQRGDQDQLPQSQRQAVIDQMARRAWACPSTLDQTLTV